MQMKLTMMALLCLSISIFSCQKVSLDPSAQQNPVNIENDPLARVATGSGSSLTECNYSWVTLVAGQHINAGTVTAVLDGDFILVTFTTANGWVLAESHLYAGDCTKIPVTKSGNASPGQFPFKATHNKLTNYTYRVPVTVMGNMECICIAAHAVVVKLDASGKVIANETAWGAGSRIHPKNWAMKFDFCTCLGN